MRLLILAALSSLVLTADSRGQTAPAEESASSLTFFDSLDRFNSGRWLLSHGWSGGPHWSCTFSNKNVNLRDGVAHLSLKGAPGRDGPFTCAEVQTNRFYGFGTYEVRLRAAAGSGTTTAFFTYTGQPHGPVHDEIDFEFLGKNPTAVQLNYHTAGKGQHEKMIELGFDASKSMNDYAFEWSPDSITWYVNGRQVHKVLAEGGQKLPSTPGKIIFYLLSGSKQLEPWLGAFEYGGEPLVASYEHVAFTEVGKPCQFAASIVCQKK